MHSFDELKIDTPEQIALELPVAGIGSRFLALAIDTLLQGLLYAVGLLFVFLIPVGSLFLGWVPRSIGPALLILFLFTVYWGYFAIFEIFWQGQTPGKRYAGIRVIKESGRPMNTYEAIGRNLMRSVDGLPGMYGVGLVCMMLNRESRRLGDFVAGTIVVHERPSEDVRPSWMSTSTKTLDTPLAGQLTADDLVLIETYLHRRFELPGYVRLQAADKIAAHLKGKGAQAQPGQAVDDFLEAVARRIRDGAGYR